MLERVWRKGNPFPFPVGRYVNWYSHYEDSTEVLKETKHRTSTWPSNPTPGHISRENHNPKMHMSPVFTAALAAIARMWKQPQPINRDWKWKKVKPLSRVRLCDPMDCSLPGFSVHGIFQARVLEWGAIAFSRGSSWPRDQTQVSRIVDRRFYPLSHQGSPHQQRNG